MTARSVDELTVLVWAPRGRDAHLAAQLLERNGIAAIACEHASDVAALVTKAGCVVLTEEALQPATRNVLASAFAEQPPWSDFPVILFAPRGAGGPADAVQAASVLGNATVLERPVQSRTLVSAVVAALRGRRRQYEARDAIRRRDEFLAMLGHELRNPLAAIRLAVEMLRRDLDVVRSREVLDRQSKNLARLVDDLLDVARVTTGKVTLQRAPVDVGELLARCVQSIEARAEERSIEIVVDARANATVDGDPVRLEEVFCNLISNAIKYSPERTRIEVAVDLADDRCIIDVIDQGIGIAPEMLPRVFDLFAQADASLARSEGGLGIGLTVVKSLVELHRGTVAAASEGPGKGSRFRVELPVIEMHASTTSDDGAALTAPGVRVLLVEDNPDVLALTSEALAAAGCEVMTACDGPSGLDLLSHHEFDVAFVDIGLPGIDGYEVARRARAQGVAPRMVAVSGYGQDRDREAALAAGFDGHLTKPVSIHTIIKQAVDPRRRSVNPRDSDRLDRG